MSNEADSRKRPLSELFAPTSSSSTSSPSLNSTPMPSFDPDIVFMCYYRSKDALPGYGAGEHITPLKEVDYRPLISIENWRKMLDTFWPAEFALDNQRWLTVEHYYQASKFRRNHPHFSASFSLESGSDLSQDPWLASAAGSKVAKYKGKSIKFRPDEIIVDACFLGPAGRSADELYRATHAKFTQNAQCRQVLLCTRNAKLTHFQQHSPAQDLNILMRVREQLLVEERGEGKEGRKGEGGGAGGGKAEDGKKAKAF